MYKNRREVRILYLYINLRLYSYFYT